MRPAWFLFFALLFPTFILCGPPLEVSVKGDVLRLNGDIVAQPTPGRVKGQALEEIDLTKIQKVLGPHTRSGYGHNNYHYVWDPLGVIVGEMHEQGASATDHGPSEGAIYNLALQFRGGRVGRRIDPQGSFRGNLVIEGLKISSATRVVDVMPALEKLGFKIDMKNSVAIWHRDRSGITLGWSGGKIEDGFSIFIFDAH